MKYIFSLLLLLMAIPSQAEIISRNLIGSAADIQITKDYQEETGMGEIVVKLCPSCNGYKLMLTSQTKISKGSTPIKLVALKTYLDAQRNTPMRLQFNKNTNQVVYITLGSNDEEYQR
jgi:hypothetical protein